MIGTSVKVVHLCALPAAFVMLPGLVATRGTISMFAFMVSASILLCAWGVLVWYRLHANSMNAFFILNGVGVAVFMFGFVIGLWEARRLGNLQWIFDDYVEWYVVGWIIAFCGVTGFTTIYGTHLRRSYWRLREYLDKGEIGDHELWSVMSPDGAIEGGQWRIGAAVGVSIGGTMLIGAMGGRSALGFFYFLLSLIVTAYLFGVLSARLWAHWKFLDWRDLRIRWSGGVGVL